MSDEKTKDALHLNATITLRPSEAVVLHLSEAIVHLNLIARGLI
jgi:hypothetical protein